MKTRYDLELARINIAWAFMCGAIGDPNEAEDAYELQESMEAKELKGLINKFEEEWQCQLYLDSNYSMTWGEKACGIYETLEDVLNKEA